MVREQTLVDHIHREPLCNGIVVNDVALHGDEGYGLLTLWIGDRYITVLPRQLASLQELLSSPQVARLEGTPWRSF